MSHSNNIIKILLRENFNIQDSDVEEYIVPHGLKKENIDFSKVRGNLRLQIEEVITDDDIEELRREVLSELKYK